MSDDSKIREAQARSTYQQGLRRVETEPVPEGQKYPPGTRVYVDVKDRSMSHFRTKCYATVEYTYAHAYYWSPNDVNSYRILFDDGSSSAWYNEYDLTLAEEIRE